MIAALRAELVKLRRRRVLIVTVVTTVIFTVGSAAIVLASAGRSGNPRDRGVTYESLSEAGGGTEVFTTAVSFAGTFLFVVFVGAVAVEFSRGTFRTMLLHQPRRLRLLAGKMAGLLLFAAVVLAAAEALTWVAAKLLAPSQDVASGDWISAAALGDAFADYGSVLFWVTGYALLGMTLAVLVRSVPVALAIGIAWAGPLEHLLQDAWDPAQRVFPGLLLEAFVAGGTSEVSASRALLTVTAYLLIAAAIAATTFARRDITA
jgi:NADH:ubiquinone oxidoreductase subunit 6 (subunit J)